MLSLSDNSSSEEDDSLEFQRLADAAVTLDTNKKVFASSRIKNENANNTEESQNISSRPSLRPKQTYSDDPYELKLAPGFKIHVANKLSAILDKELEFRSKSAVEKTSKMKPPYSGIRLLSSSKDFLDMNSIVAMANSKGNSSKLANSTKNTCTSFVNRKRENLNSQRVATSSSDSSDDEKLSEAAISFQDIKKKDELLTTYATPAAPILVIKKTKEDNRGKKDRTKSNVEVEVCVNGDSTTKKKKKKKRKEKKEDLEEKDKNTDKELIPGISKSKLCTENDLLENENNHVKKKKIKSDAEAEVCRNDDLNKKKKKKEKKENSLGEKDKNTDEELSPKIKKRKLCTENDSLENNEEILPKKKKKKNK